MSNVGTFFNKLSSTRFVVKNTAPGNKRVRVFHYPILNGETRDLLAIPGISEEDIRHSLLKGELMVKLRNGELIVIESDIDLLQFNAEQKLFLQDHGVVDGLEVSGVGSMTAEDHKKLRQLVHLADGMNGPMEGFASGIYRETLPSADPFPTSIIWWTSSAKLKKVVEKIIVYDAGKRPITVTAKVYSEAGSLLATVSDAITYSGTSVFETSRTRTVS